MAITLPSATTMPSRLTGVAPLYVQFDASGTRSTEQNTQHLAFRNLSYIWDFNDPGSSTWSFGNTFVKSKNEDFEPITAHVFETPGSYNVRLTVYDATQAIESTTVAITVSDPDSVASLTSSNIIVVATSAVFTGAPAGATQVVTSDLSTAIGNLSSTKKKMLFMRGQRWTETASNVTNNLAGRVIIGAFGTGAKPIWDYTGSNTFDSLFDYGGSALADWSFQDLDVRGGTQSAFANQDNASQILWLRCDVSSDGGVAIVCNESFGDQFHTQIAVVDSNLSAAGSYSSYFAAEKSAFLGCSLDSGDGVGCWRTQYFTQSAFQHNLLKHSTVLFNLMKFGAGKSDGGPPLYNGVPSTYSVISDNEFDDRDGGGGWTVALGPENAGQDERVSNILIERNWVRGTQGADPAGTDTLLMLFCTSTTVRNNLGDMTSSHQATNDHVAMVKVDQRGIEPTPTAAQVYNNTMFRADSVSSVGNAINFVRFVLGTGMVAKNNIAYTPNCAGAVFISDGATGTVTSTNSNNTQMRGTNPGPSWSSPVNPIDFIITSSTSYADGFGSTTNLFLDYFGRSRATVTNDIGFYQFVEGTYPWDSSEPAAGVSIARGCASMMPRFR